MWAGSGRVLLVVVLAVALAGVPVAHAQAAVTTSTGTLAACGVVAGAVATWNQALAAALTTAAGRAGPHRPGRGPEQHPGLGQPDRGRGALRAGRAQPGRGPARPQPGPAHAPDLDAVGCAIRNIVFNGRLGGVPVLSMHTTGDALVVAQQERAYAQAVRAAGNTGLLRQAFVHRAGHCSFTPEQLNAAAEALRPTLQVPTPSAFLAYSRGPYLRPFNLPPFVANVADDPLRLDTAASWSVAEVF